MDFIKPQFKFKLQMVDSDLIASVAKDEHIDKVKLTKLVEAGHVVIVKNTIRDIKPLGIGKDLRTKININLGTSPSRTNNEEELEKVRVSIEHGADTIMDLSTGSDIDGTRRAILKECPIPLGTVPVYQSFKLEEHPKTDIDTMLNVIEKHCKDGVDFVTLHCGLTQASIPAIKRRMMGVVSRGGALLVKWMDDNNKENPLYEHFDDVLEIVKEYDVVLSLGDGLRPGCLKDATDEAQLHELNVLGTLTRRSRAAGVQVIIEGPGHVPLNQIEFNVQEQKRVCDGAPFYVLGPLVTDVAPGYDHITAAIGGTLAAYFGVDYLCGVSPKEHLGLPNVDDIRVATITSRIAAHAADIAKGLPGARKWDDEMSQARANLDWNTMLKLAIDPKLADSMREECLPDDPEVCSMCGEFCSVKVSKKLLGK
jgi:phosphomethylpyrimidine synthase